MSKQLEK